VRPAGSRDIDRDAHDDEDHHYSRHGCALPCTTCTTCVATIGVPFTPPSPAAILGSSTLSPGSQRTNETKA